MDNTTRDKNGRAILVGDVMKVFHFTGARRKKHYMYKQVVGFMEICGYGGKPKVPYFEVSHLTLGEDHNYHIGMHEGTLGDYEIVQSLDCNFEDRPKT